MKKPKNVKKIINTIVSVTCVIISVYLLSDLLSKRFNELLTVLISAGIGVFLVYVLNSIVHELGHLISGVIVGLKVYSIEFLGVKLCFDNKLKISYRVSDELGNTELIPKNDDKVAKKFVTSSLFGLLATLFLLVGQVLICLFSKNIIIYSSLGITFPITAYVFLINLFPVFENNDGYLVYSYLSGGPNKTITENYFSALYQLVNGVEPCDLDSSLLVNFNGTKGFSVNVKYLRYLAYIKNDEEGAIKELRDISDLSKLNSFQNEVFEELFFSAILLKDEKFINSHKEQAVSLFERSERPQTFRVHASYRIYNDEKDWAKLILDSGIKFCDGYVIKGIAKSEKNYMQSMLKNL